MTLPRPENGLAVDADDLFLVELGQLAPYLGNAQLDA